MTGSSEDPRPPRAAERLILKLFPDQGQFTASGDLEEAFRQFARERGAAAARRWYWKQTAAAVPQIAAHMILRSFNMFTNYLKITLRAMKKRKAFTLINLFGLTVGLACVLLIVIYVRYERTYDSFHPHSGDIYRVVEYQSTKDAYQSGSPIPLAAALRADLPEVEEAASIHWAWNPLFKIGNEKFLSNRGFFADEHFFSIFRFPLSRGDERRALAEPNTMVITRELALKCFGHDDPVGKVVDTVIRGDQHFLLTVTGVLADLPDNSHLQFVVLISHKTLYSLAGIKDLMDDWSYPFGNTYVRLRPGLRRRDLEPKLTALLSEHLNAAEKAEGLQLRLQPASDIHLRPSVIDNSATKNLNLFSILAVVILITACVNFVNLSTAESLSRRKEIGVRKVIGAHRNQIAKQFLGEAILMSLVSVTLAVLLIVLVLPLFNSFAGRTIRISFIVNPVSLIVTFLFATAVGVLSGLYPAMFISAYLPARILKGASDSPARGGRLRNALVFGQFGLSAGLVLAAVIVLGQIRFIKNTDPGYHRSDILTFFTDPENGLALRDTLLTDPSIEGISFSGNSMDYAGIGEPTKTIRFQPSSGPSVEFKSQALQIDEVFLDVFNLRLVAGRNFIRNQENNKSSVLVNEAFVRRLGLADPLHERIFLEDKGEFKIIGVVKDYIVSFRKAAEPFVWRYEGNFPMVASVRIQPGKTAEALAFIKKTFADLNPDMVFDYRFLDESIKVHYKAELQLGPMIGFFSGLAVFVACLGLFGLTLFTLGRRTKEIGIRKIVGAGTGRLYVEITGGLLKLVAGAGLAAWLPAYLLIRPWLDNYAYRMPLTVTTFLSSAVLILIIAFMTVSSQVLKAARTNPAEVLRTE